MSGLVDALVIPAVVVVVVVRQFRARRVSADRSQWIVPVVLVFLAVREPGLLDSDHLTESALLVGAELLIGLAIGAGWAWTTRMWAEPDGTVWSKSTKAGAVVWAVGIAARVALLGVGALLGIHQGTSALLLALAATLLVRSGLLVWRARSLHRTAGTSTTYGDGLARASSRERM